MRFSNQHCFGLVAAVLLLGCGKTSTLSVAPGTPAPAELIPAEQLEANIYKKVLLLPIEASIELKDTSLSVLDKQPSYYEAKLEKGLLAQGFEVISPEIVARAQKGMKGSGKLSSAEKAMMMGKETNADAVFLVPSLSIVGTTDYYTVEDLQTQPADASRVKTDKKGRLYHSESEQCVFAVPYYEVRLEGKLIDARDGSVLWVGSGRQTVVDTLDESWVAKLDKDCELQKENFVFADYVAAETTLDEAVVGLVGRMVAPMKKSALAGSPIEADKPKPEPKPKPKPEPKPEPPKKKTATVSTKKASLRAGPGSKNDRIRRVTRKTKVEVLETMGEWSKVKMQDGTTGWMHESVIIMND